MPKFPKFPKRVHLVETDPLDQNRGFTLLEEAPGSTDIGAADCVEDGRRTAIYELVEEGVVRVSRDFVRMSKRER